MLGLSTATASSQSGIFARNGNQLLQIDLIDFILSSQAVGAKQSSCLSTGAIMRLAGTSYVTFRQQAYNVQQIGSLKTIVDYISCLQHYIYELQILSPRGNGQYSTIKLRGKEGRRRSLQNGLGRGKDDDTNCV